MKIYFPIAKVDAERREVWGYASTEAQDDQGEIVTREALTAALGDYMKFANIREMHQLSAVGVAQEAIVDDKGLYIGAKIVDDQAWRKVTEGVYKGYSIGGHVTERDPTDYKTITGLVLNEISLVDRPANPEAVFDYWKAAGILTRDDPQFNPPVQVWACGVSDHRHLGKADAMKCIERRASAAQSEDAANEPDGAVEYADPGYQSDHRKRYPIDTERHIRAAWDFINRPKNAEKYTPNQIAEIKARIVTAWREIIDSAGPPLSQYGEKISQTVLRKALWEVGRVAQIIVDLNWLGDMLGAMDSESTPQLLVVIGQLCAGLNRLIAGETADLLDDAESETEPLAAEASEMLAMAAGSVGTQLVAELCKAGSPSMQKFAATLLSKAKHSRDDQVLLDLAHHAAAKCLKMAGLGADEQERMRNACDALRMAGARPTEMAYPGVEPVSLVPPVSPAATRGGSGEEGVARALDAIAAALAKRGRGHQALMDVAHDCIDKLTDGATCSAAKLGARHSMETMGHLAQAHDHLVKAGAACGALNRTEEESQGTRFETLKTGRSVELAKALAEERADKAVLLATVADLVPRLDQLAKRVDDIARTPLPPLTVAKAYTAISKQQDGGGATGSLSPEELAAAFAKMTKEEQTLTLIKASYARPIQPAGTTAAAESREPPAG